MTTPGASQTISVQVKLVGPGGGVPSGPGTPRGVLSGSGAQAAYLATAGIGTKLFNFMKGPLGLVGIALTLTSILKQSKIASTVSSTFMKILGAIVDVILAPFMPLIAKGLQKFAEVVPAIQKWAEEWAPRIIEILKGFWVAL